MKKTIFLCLAMTILAATYIYDGNIKEVYQRPDGALKIKFMNDSDVMIVTDINV